MQHIITMDHDILWYPTGEKPPGEGNGQVVCSLDGDVIGDGVLRRYVSELVLN